jgi:hypothetical protein
MQRMNRIPPDLLSDASNAASSALCQGRTRRSGEGDARHGCLRRRAIMARICSTMADAALMRSGGIFSWTN